MENAEAKLVKREKDWYPLITYRKKEEKKMKKKVDIKPTSIVAVDINQDIITVGNDKSVIEILTRLDDAYHYMNEAQKL